MCDFGRDGFTANPFPKPQFSSVGICKTTIQTLAAHQILIQFQKNLYQFFIKKLIYIGDKCLTMVFIQTNQFLVPYYFLFVNLSL